MLLDVAVVALAAFRETAAVGDLFATSGFLSLCQFRPMASSPDASQQWSTSMAAAKPLMSLKELRLQKVWNVTDFAKRFRLDRFEESRLLKLLGPLATERQLLMNAARKPV